MGTFVKIVENTISVNELSEMSLKMFERIVKAVVDVEREILVVDASMHSDQEEFLLENDSLQENLWGINLAPDKFGQEEFVVFDSMINMRPAWGNRSRGVEDPVIQKRIRQIVNKRVRA